MSLPSVDLEHRPPEHVAASEALRGDPLDDRHERPSLGTHVTTRVPV